MTRFSVEFSREGRPPVAAALFRSEVRPLPAPASGFRRVAGAEPPTKDALVETYGMSEDKGEGVVDGGRSRRASSASWVGSGVGPTVRPGFFRGLSFPDGKGLSAVAPLPCRGLSRRCGTGPFAWEESAMIRFSRVTAAILREFVGRLRDRTAENETYDPLQESRGLYRAIAATSLERGRVPRGTGASLPSDRWPSLA